MGNGHVVEPERRVPVVARPDVLVVGAGAAGIAAAVAAARRGAETWLVDAEPFVGGLATFGLINLLLTMDDGAGTQVVGGLCQELVDRLDARGEAVFPPAAEWNAEEPSQVERWKRWGLVWGAPESVRYSVAFDPDDFADAALAMLDEAGVHLRLHTWGAGVLVGDGRVTAVLVESKAGREAIVPGVVIDGTGDGDIVARAGAATEQVDIPPHLWFRVGGVTAEPDDLPPFVFRTRGAGRVLVPWGPHPDRIDATDPEHLTRALLLGRREGRAHLERLRATPGFEDAWLDDHARLLGVTESRRLVGDVVIAKEDGKVAADPVGPDTIARTGHWTRRDVVFDVPLGALTAPGLANVLASGRCISTTRYVHQATKEIPAAMATGEAAGAAAARMVDGDLGDVHALDPGALQVDLRAAGALLGPA